MKHKSTFQSSNRRRNSSRIFIVMQHLYGTREDTKIWAKIISAHAKKCSRMEVSVAEGRWVGQKRVLCSNLSGHERITGRLQVWRSNKYSDQYPWVLRWSLEKTRANLCIARGHFGTIISMKIDTMFQGKARESPSRLLRARNSAPNDSAGEILSLPLTEPWARREAGSDNSITLGT